MEADPAAVSRTPGPSHSSTSSTRSTSFTRDRVRTFSPLPATPHGGPSSDPACLDCRRLARSPQPSLEAGARDRLRLDQHQRRCRTGPHQGPPHLVRQPDQVRLEERLEVSRSFWSARGQTGGTECLTGCTIERRADGAPLAPHPPHFASPRSSSPYNSGGAYTASRGATHGGR